MNLTKLCLIPVIVLVQSCAIAYKSDEYVITPERIPDFSMSGSVAIKNKQTDDSERQLCETCQLNVVGNYKDVSEQLAEQLKKEIGIHASNAIEGSPKSIDVAVTHVTASQPSPFNLLSSISVTLKLDDGPVIEKVIKNGNAGPVDRLLDGNIALAVIDILKDPKILEYLSK